MSTGNYSLTHTLPTNGTLLFDKIRTLERWHGLGFVLGFSGDNEVYREKKQKKGNRADGGGGSPLPMEWFGGGAVKRDGDRESTWALHSPQSQHGIKHTRQVIFGLIHNTPNKKTTLTLQSSDADLSSRYTMETENCIYYFIYLQNTGSIQFLNPTVFCTWMVLSVRTTFHWNRNLNFS